MPARRWTDAMVQYLHTLLACEVMGDAEAPSPIRDLSERQLRRVQEACTADDRNLVASYARRISDDYHDGVLHHLHKMFWHEIHDGDAPEEYITWNAEHRNVWMHGVAALRSVRLRYDSETSGETDRMVDPYTTRGAYGIGYCHLRKDIRMFRFDRVIDIAGTPHAFTKPRDWKEQWQAQQRARAIV